MPLIQGSYPLCSRVEALSKLAKNNPMVIHRAIKGVILILLLGGTPQIYQCVRGVPFRVWRIQSWKIKQSVNMNPSRWIILIVFHFQLNELWNPIAIKAHWINDTVCLETSKIQSLKGSPSIANSMILMGLISRRTIFFFTQNREGFTTRESFEKSVQHWGTVDPLLSLIVVILMSTSFLRDPSPSSDTLWLSTENIGPQNLETID